ncbi:MAG: PKD domain-containing protein, partial [Flavobacteriales bacterium]
MPQPTSDFEFAEDYTCYFPYELTTINTSEGAGAYQWQLNGQDWSQSTNGSLAINDLGAFDVGLIAINQYGCTDTSVQVFNSHPLPDLDFTGDTLMGCTPHEVDFINLSQGASVYYWQFGDGDAAYATAPSHTYTQAGSYDVSLIGITDQGCMDTLTIDNLVVAFPVPFALFTMDPDSTSILESEITFLEQSMGATQWRWDFGDGNFGVFQNAVHRYYEHGYYPVTLTVWNQFGCPSKAINYLKIEDVFLVYVPNAFTPDADGTNDLFFPEVNAKQLIESYKFQVYDRWGTIVFETDDPDMPWIGNVRGGDYYAEDGIYTWQVFITRLDSEDPYFARGHVTLLR